MWILFEHSNGDLLRQFIPATRLSAETIRRPDRTFVSVSMYTSLNTGPASLLAYILVGYLNREFKCFLTFVLETPEILNPSFLMMKSAIKIWNTICSQHDRKRGQPLWPGLVVEAEWSVNNGCLKVKLDTKECRKLMWHGFFRMWPNILIWNLQAFACKGCYSSGWSWYQYGIGRTKCLP